MKAELEQTCRRFVENRDALKHVFHLESEYTYPAAAGILAARGISASEERLKDSRKLLKEKAGVFSNFRGTLAMPITAILSASADPGGRMDRALENYAVLKEHFFGSTYLALVAFLMADLTSGLQAEERAARGKTIYKRMKQEHPFLTSSEDSVFAVLMAFSTKSDDQLIADMEECYTLLKTRFSHSNAVQSASHVLSMVDGAPEEKAGRMIALCDALKAGGVKDPRHQELAVVAAAAVLDVPIETLAADIQEADAFLAQQKGYGALGLSRRTRLMHATMLVSGLYAPKGQTEAAALASTLALVAAQQAAMCAVIASSSATAASAASH